MLGRAALAANTAVFYVVKSAMEYSKSPRTPPQVAVGFLCNLFRRLNNIHPLIPLAFIAGLSRRSAGAIGDTASLSCNRIAIGRSLACNGRFADGPAAPPA